MLHDIWVGSPQTEGRALTKPVANYLNELQSRLKLADDVARASCKTTQQRYTDNSNAGFVPKSFEVGDSVLVLTPDSTCKFTSRWVGPGTVNLKVSENSYHVALDDGSVRHIHANKLRRFVPQVSNIGVVFEEDDQFGGVHYYPDLTTTLSPGSDSTVDRFDSLNLDHLTAVEQHELRSLLRRFAGTFNDIAGVSSVGIHAIDLVPNFRPKRLKPW